MKLADLPVIAGVFVLGLASLCTIIILSLYDKTIPNEIAPLPGVAIGALAGAYVGSKRDI